MKHEIKISVIMSVKNGANFLNRSITSIQDQTFKDWELIICDDGSTDNTWDILRDYAAKDNRITILHNDVSRGSADGRNQCISKSIANYIAIQDCDDSSDIFRLEKQYDFITSHPEYAIVGTACYNVFNDGEYKKLNIRPQEPKAIDQIIGGKFIHASFMINKSVLNEVGNYTANKYTLRSQDYHMVMKILGAGYKMYNMQEPLYNYYIDDDTIGRAMNWNRVIGLMWIRWDSYRRNHLPLWTYIFCLKPVVTNLIPRKLMRKHLEKAFGKTK